MKIVLHILLKDLRRHWIEIGLFVLVCAAWTWQISHPMAWEWLRQREMVSILLFGLWIFVTVRVVHGECLVGDREFWRTRPYHWGQLMAAKALFLVLCLNGPLLAAQIFLLWKAGIPFSWALALGLILLQLEFVFIVTFFTTVLASVTETLVQWIMAVAGLILFGMMLSWLPWDKLPPALEGGENLATMLGAAFIVPAMVFALLWQYARRRVWLARLALGCAVVAVPLTILVAPTPLVRSIAYPHHVGDAELQLAIAANSESGQREYTRNDGRWGDEAKISIPVTAGTVEPDRIIDVDGYRVTLRGDNGWRWQSKWMSQTLKLSKNEPHGNIGFNMPVKLADQLARAHAQATVELAFGVYRLGAVQRVETGAERFILPGAGYCRWIDRKFGAFWLSGPTCVAPFHLPEVTVLQVESEDNTCRPPEGEPPLPAGHYATRIEYGSGGMPDFDPNPVHEINLFMGDWIPAILSASDAKNNRSAALCKGTPILIRTGSFSGRMGATFDLGSMGVEKRVAEVSEDSE